MLTKPAKQGRSRSLKPVDEFFLTMQPWAERGS